MVTTATMIIMVVKLLETVFAAACVLSHWYALVLYMDWHFDLQSPSLVAVGDPSTFWGPGLASGL